MKIQFYIREVYGNRLMYILDKDIAFRIQVLTGQKTISTNHVSALETLGFEFEQVLPPAK